MMMTDLEVEGALRRARRWVIYSALLAFLASVSCFLSIFARLAVPAIVQGLFASYWLVSWHYWEGSRHFWKKAVVDRKERSRSV